MGAGAVPRVVKLLDHPRSDIRLAACRILARIGPEAKAVVPALAKCLDDSETRVWKEAIRA